METIQELRKKYSFITYGSVYERMTKALAFFVWLQRELYMTQPTYALEHDWYKLHFRLHKLVFDYMDKVNRIPEPLEVHKKECEPWDNAEWPAEHELDAINSAYVAMQHTDEIAILVGDILVRNRYISENVGGKDGKLMESIEQWKKRRAREEKREKAKKKETKKKK